MAGLVVEADYLIILAGQVTRPRPRRRKATMVGLLVQVLAGLVHLAAAAAQAQ
jgi:hypothetical protein